MSRIPNEQTISNPKLIDVIVSEINLELMDSLTWLYHAYNKTFNLTTTKEGREYKYPAFYVGNNEYFSLLPNEDFINYCFWDIGKSYELVGYKRKTLNEFKVDYKLIFWFDYTKVIAGVNYRTIEPIKQQVLDVFKELVLSNYGRITIDNITDDFNTIFNNFSTKEIDKQYTMHPYGIVSFTGSIYFKQSC